MPNYLNPSTYHGGSQVIVVGAPETYGTSEFEDTGWIEPDLLSGWSHYGGSHERVGYRRLSTGLIMLKGLLRGTVSAHRTDIFVLPDDFAPEASRLFLCCGYNGVASTAGNPWRIDVRSDGRVHVQDIFGVTGGDLPGVPWLSLENVQYTV